VADKGFVWTETYTIFEALFQENNTKLGMKMNIYLE